MAEACARRPQIVEEELKVAATEVPKPKINMYSVFLETLGSWYMHMKPAERNKLTSKRFKRRAVVILERLRYPYSSLPKDWVATAVDRFGIKLYAKRKKAKEAAVLPDFDVKFKLDTMGVICGLPITYEGVTVKGKIVNPVKMEPMDCDPVENDSNNMELVDKKDKTQSQGMPVRRKKIVDLTDLPPPVDWIMAHASGIHLPRELAIYSGDTQNVLFYDYSPETKCETCEDSSANGCHQYKSRVHDQNNFSWFRSTALKEEEAEYDDKLVETMKLLEEHYSQNAVQSVGEDSVSRSPPIQIPSHISNQDSEDSIPISTSPSTAEDGQTEL